MQWKITFLDDRESDRGKTLSMEYVISLSLLSFETIVDVDGGLFMDSRNEQNIDDILKLRFKKNIVFIDGSEEKKLCKRLTIVCA